MAGLIDSFEYVTAAGLRLRNDNVCIRLHKGEQQIGPLVIPEAKPNAVEGVWATVVAVGPGPSFRRNCDKCGAPRDRYPMAVRVGDRVIADNASVGDVVFLNGEEHRICREVELLAVYADDAAA